MASTTSGDVLPTGGRIFTSIPDMFFIPEFIFGGLVWMLVAATHVYPGNPLGWVMFVSVFCFIMTTLFLFIYLCGGNQSSTWPSLDVFYHFVAVLFYLSAAVLLTYITILKGWGLAIVAGDVELKPLSNDDNDRKFRLDIAATVMAYLATTFYFLHAIFSALRWKRA